MDIAINKLKYRLLPAYLKKRWDYDDFLYYGMQRMKRSQIDELLTGSELFLLEKQYNDDNYRKLFNSKRAFNEKFCEFIIRDIIYLSDVSKEEFDSFIRVHKKVILKPDDMYAGIGVYIAGINEKDNIYFSDGCPSFSELKENGYIAEEYVYQDKEYDRIYSGCLNTVRVTTLVDNNGVSKFLFAVNQFGSNGSIVDNSDEASIWGICDENGRVIAADRDTDTGVMDDKHPDSGESIMGFCNPRFDETKKIALEAALVVPQCRLIGWDIAVRNDGRIEIIEGNVTPELDLYQMLSGKGLRKSMIS